MKRNKDKDSYIKFLAVIDILIKESDEKNTLTVSLIQDKLYDKGYDFHIDYRLMNSYIDNYNSYYDDTIIEKEKRGRQYHYYYVNPALDFMEAKAIVDLIYSSDFFTLQTKENYKKRIQDMFSIHFQMYFDKKIKNHVVKNENDQVFYKELEQIIFAIVQHKKISFLYEKPSLNRDYQHKRVEYAPIDTYFSNNEYYLLVQKNDNPSSYKTYRLDYVKDVQIIEDSNVFFSEENIQSFENTLNQSSYMYSKGDAKWIELDFDESVYPNIIDKFGKDIQPRLIKDHTYRISVQHIVNSTFYAWIIGFGGKIQISGNKTQKELFKSFLREYFLNI